MRTELTLTLAADPDCVHDAAVAVRTMLAAAHPDVALECELAVAEACANVVEHAYGGDAGSVRVVLRATTGAFCAAVCDAAPPFAGPAAVDMPPETAEGGRGLALLDMCMDRLVRLRAGDENRLLMVRSLRRGAAA